MKDRFSDHAGSYSQFRPLYPGELYKFIFSHVTEFRSAWDAGTGNGQAARELARKFEKVYATDISIKQLENAVQADNIFYSQSGETINLPQRSVDLITVAQAIHWFDRKKFYEEVQRVAKPGCVLAVWGYGLLSINEDIDAIVRNFYANIIGPYWDPERKHIDLHFSTIEFPFEEIEAPKFNFSFQWTLAELEGYLLTWSSVQKYIRLNGNDPLQPIIERISPLWKTDRITVTFPLFMRIGKVYDSIKKPDSP